MIAFILTCIVFYYLFRWLTPHGRDEKPSDEKPDKLKDINFHETFTTTEKELESIINFIKNNRDKFPKNLEITVDDDGKKTTIVL
ncbi:MAG: hypothetical protein GX282_02700 [Campylobacteraceae bacterium]|nr:hypothetical protein [Campylobacteraceae bacterium]